MVLDRNRDSKKFSVQKRNSPVKTQYVPESCAKGMLQHSQTVVSVAFKIYTNEVF
jgi:hypothetical protein